MYIEIWINKNHIMPEHEPPRSDELFPHSMGDEEFYYVKCNFLGTPTNQSDCEFFAASACVITLSNRSVHVNVIDIRGMVFRRTTTVSSA